MDIAEHVHRLLAVDRQQKKAAQQTRAIEAERLRERRTRDLAKFNLALDQIILPTIEQYVSVLQGNGIAAACTHRRGAIDGANDVLGEAVFSVAPAEPGTAPSSVRFAFNEPNGIGVRFGDEAAGMADKPIRVDLDGLSASVLMRHLDKTVTDALR